MNEEYSKVTDTYQSKRCIAANYCELSNKVQPNVRKILPNEFWSNIGPTKLKYYPICSSELQIHSFQLHFAIKFRIQLCSTYVTSAWKGV